MTGLKGMKDIICTYYADLFSSLCPSHTQVAAAVQNLNLRVSAEMNDDLTKPFTSEEIQCAIMQMHPSKAHGLDGLSPAFYQDHWGVVGKRVITTCLSILNDGANVSVLNHTVVVLILKNKNPQAVSEYRPISLCNVIYKILAKVLANRLKGVLHAVISCSQSALIPNKLITNDVILGYECLHKLRSCKLRKGGIVALKLNISKAYDKVEWIFLKNVMIRLGFSERWV